jgi:predicted dehydrogenase
MRIGILSFAHHHAESYIANLRTLADVDLIGVADEDQARGRQFASQFNTHYYPSYEALIEGKPDGVILCTENNKHRPLIELAASRGVHVLCEKPIATSVEDAQAEVAACQKAGVILMTAFPMRFSPPLLEVKARLEAGDFGQVYCFNATNQGELPTKHRAWFVDPVLAGGGAIADHTVHVVDILRWFLQDELAEIYAQSNKIFHAKEVEVETGGLEMLTFRGGAFASLDCSWCRPPYWPSWGGLTFEMVSERGAVIVDGFKQNLTVYSHTNQRPLWSFWGSDTNQAMIAEFLSAIREERQPKVTGVDGLRAVEAVVAAYQSIRTRQPVKLEIRQ